MATLHECPDESEEAPAGEAGTCNTEQLHPFASHLAPVGSKDFTQCQVIKYQIEVRQYFLTILEK